MDFHQYYTFFEQMKLYDNQNRNKINYFAVKMIVNNHQDFFIINI